MKIRIAKKVAAPMIIYIIALLSLAGCGGGGDGSPSENALKILIPVYSYPTSNNDWESLAVESGRHPGLISIVASADSGPGTSRDNIYAAAVDNFRSHGGICIGYVGTDYGSRDSQSVKAEIDRWYSFYSLDGIFLDEQTIASGDESYYQDIYSYIKTRHPNALVVGNPGSNTRESYIALNNRRSSDVFCIYENNGASFGSWTPSSWTGAYDRSNFAVLIYDAGPTVWRDLVDRAADLKVGWIYITDDRQEDPWDELPPYFSEFCSYVSGKQ